VVVAITLMLLHAAVYWPVVNVYFLDAVEAAIQQLKNHPHVSSSLCQAMISILYGLEFGNTLNQMINMMKIRKFLCPHRLTGMSV